MIRCPMLNSIPRLGARRHRIACCRLAGARSARNGQAIRKNARAACIAEFSRSRASHAAQTERSSLPLTATTKSLEEAKRFSGIRPNLLNWASHRSQRDFAAEALENDVTTPLRSKGGTQRALKRFFNFRRTRAWREALAELRDLNLTSCSPMDPGRGVEETAQGATSDDGDDFYFQDTARNLVLDTLARSAR